MCGSTARTLGRAGRNIHRPLVLATAQSRFRRNAGNAHQPHRHLRIGGKFQKSLSLEVPTLFGLAHIYPATIDSRFITQANASSASP